MNSLLRTPPCFLLFAIDARRGCAETDGEGEEGVEAAGDDVGLWWHFGRGEKR